MNVLRVRAPSLTPHPISVRMSWTENTNNKKGKTNGNQ